ncbi:MAG: gamma carbonic anhydrase family protein [Promethearchaeota archaeon]|nr:MAG: gamma carbonic anhydrase family protein [Candidatus Lokiarchaeota archaeon]
MPIIIPSPITGKKPKIHDSVYIAPTAVIIGDVIIEENTNIWFGAVIRADRGPVKIGKNTSIQENVTIHIEKGTSVIIGSNCIIGHHAMIHGPAEIGDGCLIGIGSNVLHNTKMNDGSMIAAGAVITNKEIPSRQLWAGVPAKFLKDLPEEEELIGEKTAGDYVNNGKLFREFFEKNPEFTKM